MTDDRRRESPEGPETSSMDVLASAHDADDDPNAAFADFITGAEGYSTAAASSGRRDHG